MIFKDIVCYLLSRIKIIQIEIAYDYIQAVTVWYLPVEWTIPTMRRTTETGGVCG